MFLVRLFLVCGVALLPSLGKASVFEPMGHFSLAADSFRGVPDGVSQNNNGALLAAQIAQRIIPALRLNAEVGVSLGIYDWAGRSGVVINDNNFSKSEKQTFLTGGVYTQTPYRAGVNAGFVFDYMWSRGFGAFAMNPSIGQFRGQLGYVFCARHELGVWATLRRGTCHKNLVGIPLTFRAIDQVNLFWTYDFNNGSYLTLSGGVPYGHSLFFSQGKPGRYLLSGRCAATLAKCWSLSGHFAYMTGRNLLGPSIQSSSYAYNACVGLTYFFKRNSVNNKRAYLPTADNSNFLIDTNFNQITGL